MVDDAFADCRPTILRSHVRFRPGFVNEHEFFRVDGRVELDPFGSPGDNVFSMPFGSEESLFFRVIFKCRKKSHSVAVLTETCLDSISQNSASVASGWSATSRRTSFSWDSSFGFAPCRCCLGAIEPVSRRFLRRS